MGLWQVLRNLCSSRPAAPRKVKSRTKGSDSVARPHLGDREAIISNEAEEDDGDDLEARAAKFIARGSKHAARGDFDRAIASFSEALECQPENAMAFYNRGWAYG